MKPADCSLHAHTLKYSLIQQIHFHSIFHSQVLVIKFYYEGSFTHSFLVLFTDKTLDSKYK